MLDSHIADDERLYRVIKNIPSWWNYKRNKPSTAAFKDSNGISVDREGDRSNENCIKSLESRFRRYLKAIVSLTGRECRNCDTYPLYSPSRKNNYHSLIHDGPETIEISSTKAFNLCNIVRIDVS